MLALSEVEGSLAILLASGARLLLAACGCRSRRAVWGAAVLRDPYARVLTAPPRLRPGDRVAVVAPSGPVDPEKLERGLATLRALGLDPVVGEHARACVGYLAGDDAARLADLHAAFADREAAAVLFARGGYGLSRIVDRLDLAPLRARPKLLMGFSDLTVLHLAAASRADLASVYGPMVASNLAREPLNDATLRAMQAIVGPEPAPRRTWSVGVEAGLQFSGAAGRMTAPLVGGCLTLLSATIGTPFEVGTRGGVLYWEEVGEDLYRLDRLLSHLRLAGKLDGLAGMIVGTPVGVTRARRQDPVTDLTEFVRTWLGDVPYPVVTQFPCHHDEPMVPLPLHRLVTIDGAARTVEIPCLV